MVKHIPSSRNKHLSAIKEGFLGKGPYADDIKKSFVRTKYLCNSIGKLVYYEGEYDYKQHKQAYERAKMWMPSIVEGKIIWKANPKMKPFNRLFDTMPDLNIMHESQEQTHTHKTFWNKDIPPMQVGMIGEYKGEKAIVVDKGYKTSKRRKLIGIGDKDNLFLAPRQIDKLGSYTEVKEKPIWIVHTKDAKHEVCSGSRAFKRKNLVIKDFDKEKHLQKYLQ